MLLALVAERNHALPEMQPHTANQSARSLAPELPARHGGGQVRALPHGAAAGNEQAVREM
jgi:hypothetical protein